MSTICSAIAAAALRPRASTAMTASEQPGSVGTSTNCSAFCGRRTAERCGTWGTAITSSIDGTSYIHSLRRRHVEKRNVGTELNDVLASVQHNPLAASIGLFLEKAAELRLGSGVVPSSSSSSLLLLLLLLCCCVVVLLCCCVVVLCVVCWVLGVGCWVLCVVVVVVCCVLCVVCVCVCVCVCVVVVVVVVVAAAAAVVVVVVVVVEWVYYSNRIIVVSWADLSDLFRRFSSGKRCVFVSRPMKIVTFLRKKR